LKQLAQLDVPGLEAYAEQIVCGITYVHITQASNLFVFLSGGEIGSKISGAKPELANIEVTHAVIRMTWRG